jgi:hypothetical protein
MRRGAKMALFKKKETYNEQRYENKSQRLHAWSDLIKSISKFLWLFLIIVILVILGKVFVFKPDKDKVTQPIKKPVITQVDWSKINEDIKTKMMQTREETQILASKKLDEWIDKNMERVDNDFLEWYFSYWTQQELGIKSLLAQVMHWVDSDNPSAAEKITLAVQEEFTSRVIRPQIAQLEIERIINEIVAQYSALLKKKLEQIPSEYEISKVDWDRYIEDISIMVRSVEANRTTPLTLKAIVGLTAGGTIVLFNSLRPIITKIGAKISSKLAAKSAAKMAAKTGSKVAVKTGGKFLGTIIAIGIIIWDVWDHYATKQKAKPILRQNIQDYLNEVKESILHDPAYGIMTIIYEMEKNLTLNKRN